MEQNSLDTDPCKYSKLYSRSTNFLQKQKQYNGKNQQSFQLIVLEKLNIHMKKRNLYKDYTQKKKKKDYIIKLNQNESWT